MTLFDFLVSQNAQGLPRAFVLNPSNSSRFFKSPRPIVKSFKLAYIVKSPEILAGSKKDIAKKRFIKQNFWQRIMNAIWSQAVFLSVPGRSSDKYFVELNYLNINEDKNTSKSLVTRFSKSLLEGSVCSSLSSDNYDSFHASLSIRYPWAKVFKLKQEKMLGLFYANAYRQYLKKAQNYLSQNNAMNHLPLFVVSNNLGQMIISEPPNELEKGKDLFDYILPDLRPKRLHQSWFFVNFEDAQEYMGSISKYYGLKKDHLKIFACNFSSLYSILDKFSHQVYFRLIPDLEEVSSLIKNYRFRSNISFHEKQKYGSGYFQGQPLYMLRAKDQYMYPYVYNNQQVNKHSLIFTSYKTACNVLGKIANESPNLKKIKIPDLIVYNLESFMEDQFSLGEGIMRSFLLVPSQNSYWFTKNHFLRKKTNLMRDSIANYISFAQLWSKRILWSLTSRQPKDW